MTRIQRVTVLALASVLAFMALTTRPGADMPATSPDIMTPATAGEAVIFQP